MLSDYHLARYRLTQEEYTQRATQQARRRVRLRSSSTQLRRRAACSRA